MTPAAIAAGPWLVGTCRKKPEYLRLGPTSQADSADRRLCSIPNIRFGWRKALGSGTQTCFRTTDNWDLLSAYFSACKVRDSGSNPNRTEPNLAPRTTFFHALFRVLKMTLIINQSYI